MAIPDALADLGGNQPVELAPITRATVRVQLWDWPLRVFHWSLLTAVATAIVTGELGGDWMVWHGRAGITIVGLLAFRLVWGLVGSSTARFAHFAPTPRKILAYLKGQWRGAGHNPLGALSVFALLGVLSFQAGSGLVSNDDIAFTGPLASLISDELSHTLTNRHRQVAYVLFVLLGLHIVAIAFYAQFKKDKLVRPMVTGWKDIPADLPKPRRARRIALVTALAIGAAAAYAASGAWIKPSTTPQVTPASAELAPGIGTDTSADTSSGTRNSPNTPATSAAPGKAPAW